ncbi:response regulator [Crocinitomicaceae bacterium]|nr:response regulator [Crocinitomicaceae bacterium]
MRKILTIEDEKELRETLTDILEVNGYNVFQAADGEEGVKVFKNTAPNLVICDVNMPKMDGLECLEILKTLVPESEFPPFIFLTAKTKEEIVSSGMDLDAVDFIAKPYSASELLKLIELRLNKES